MRRRTFLKMTGTASIGLSVAGLPLSVLPRTTGRSDLPAAGKEDRRPNILLIMTDQQFADALGCAGAQNLKTPAMDSLAGNGLRFSRAYCIQPLCVPSRVGMFTGRYPHEAGAPINKNV